MVIFKHLAIILRLCLVCAFCVHVWAQNVFQHYFFIFFLLSAVKANFFNREQCICALFTDPQISHFINFFIKNGSHDTIHTFKNYFAIVFFSFQFQFSGFSCIQTYPTSYFICWANWNQEESCLIFKFKFWWVLTSSTGKISND